MARVPMSPRLKDAILNKVSERFNQRKNKIMEEIDSVTLADVASRELFSTEDLHTLQRYTKYVIFNDTVVLRGTHDRQVAVKITGEKFPAPVNKVSYYSRESAYKVRPGGEADKIIQKAYEEQEVIEKERVRTIDDISRLLDSAPSLNRVAEVWPSVLEYIPSETRDRYNAPDAPRKTRKTMADLGEDAQVSLVKLNIIERV